jgi:hypothetical protein
LANFNSSHERTGASETKLRSSSSAITTVVPFRSSLAERPYIEMGALQSTENVGDGLGRMLRGGPIEGVADGEPQQSASSNTEMSIPNEESVAIISLADVLILMANVHYSRMSIPLVLMADILNYSGILSPIKRTRKEAFRSQNNCNTIYLSVPLPRSLYIEPMHVRIIVVSKDQGWSSYPQERGKRSSHTWGELMVSTDLSTRYPLFRNIHAGAVFERHEVDIPLNDGVPGEYAALADAIKSITTAPGMRSRQLLPP